jgi:hypothetical protein
MPNDAEAASKSETVLRYVRDDDVFAHQPVAFVFVGAASLFRTGSASEPRLFDRLGQMAEKWVVKHVKAMRTMYIRQVRESAAIAAIDTAAVAAAAAAAAATASVAATRRWRGPNALVPRRGGCSSSHWPLIVVDVCHRRCVASDEEQARSGSQPLQSTSPKLPQQPYPGRHPPASALAVLAMSAPDDIRAAVDAVVRRLLHRLLAAVYGI